MMEPSPFFFGPSDTRLFGWLHMPAVAPPAGLGLVICNPFGFEEVCAHRSLSHLANQAAVAGVPALRFDYAGCGNSSGDEFDPDTLARWLASIHHAVDTLKAHSGVQRVCLLGLRLGATLATLAALERSDVEGLVLIAPVVKGRLYVRELRVLLAAGETGGSPASPSDHLLEAAGFFMTDQTTQAVSALDLGKLDKAPAHHVLIVERDDLPSSTQWVPALDALGVQVQSESWPGYANMMLDPQRAVVPEAMLSGIVGALQTWSLAVPPGSSAVQAEPALDDALQRETWRETAVRIATAGEGRGAALFGVVTTGAPTQAKPQVGVLMINSGAVHHIGPNRLWVRLARRWAERGVLVLRLDLSGIGDSPPRPTAQANVVYSAEAAMDIDAALQYLQNQVGVNECHLVGLCSGAYHAFKAGVAGKPVKTAIMINPLTFFWEVGRSPDEGIKDYELLVKSESYRKQMFSLEPWRKLLFGKLDLVYLARFVTRRLSATVQLGVQKLARGVGAPIKDDLARELAQSARHGVQQKFVFAIGDPGYEMLQIQGGRRLEKLRAERALSVDCLDQADHTFTRLEARERLVHTLDRLMFP